MVALLGAATCPAQVDLADTHPSTAEAGHLVAAPPVRWVVRALELPALPHPPAWMAGLGPFPNLRAFSLALQVCTATPTTLLPTPWTGLPALEELTVRLSWHSETPWTQLAPMAAFLTPIPTVQWVVGSVVASPCRATLRSLQLCGLFHVGPDTGVGELGPLATLPSFRLLTAWLREAIVAGPGHAFYARTLLPSTAAQLRAILPLINVELVPV